MLTKVSPEAGTCHSMTRYRVMRSQILKEEPDAILAATAARIEIDSDNQA